MSKAQVGIVMGSESDLAVMRQAAEILDELEIDYELTIVSAHRTPQRMVEYGQSARERGLRVLVAGAGGAAHLPGMLASLTPLPVIGVPIKASISLDGWDSLLSIVQMPPGVPVATVGIDNAQNAGLLAAQILGSADPAVCARIADYKQGLADKVQTMVDTVADDGWRTLED